MKEAGLVFIGFLVGIVLTMIMVYGPLQSHREKQIYLAGVRHGQEGNFTIVIDETLWHLDAIEDVLDEVKREAKRK